ncbi:MAG: hypothetical protein J1F10_05120 [Muribaculaceae bacterium]|nr:hypothetical protein [Muribaculaceae bacterium]
MTSLLILIKHRCPQIWRAVELVNGRLFAWRRPGFGHTVAEVLAEYGGGEFGLAPVAAEDIPALSEFLNRQPAESREHFDPHGFDAGTLTRLLRNPAFAMMKAVRRDDGSLAGYFFLRCFFIGRAFHGLIVDRSCANRGLGTSMWAVSSQICDRCGLRMFATVSRHNGASLASARRGTQVTVTEELAGGYLLVECKSGNDEKTL